MSSVMSKTMLSEPRRQLLELMQTINFGQIVNLPVRNGQPVINEQTGVFRVIKFGGDNRVRPEIARADFVLKDPVCELMAQLETLGNGVLRLIEIQHGLPFRMTLEGIAA